MTPELTEEQQSVDIAPSTPTPEPSRSPGAMVRRARERVRMAPEELAAQTKLARSTLEALERDDFKVLVEPVYVRGYYRKCAKVLGISEKDLVDAYDALVGPRLPEAPAKLRLASGSELGSGNRLPVALAIAAAIAGVIVLSLIWFARNEVNHVLPPLATTKVDVAAVGSASEAPEAAGEPSAAPAAGLASTTVAAPADTNATPATAAPVTGSTPSPAAPVATAPVAANPAQPEAAKPVAAAPAPVVSAGNATLVLQVNVTSWARIDDASGKTLVNGLVRSGEKQTLTGPAPFSVFLGNAPGVKLEVNGKAIDLGKYTAQNNTARFSAAP